MSPQLSLSSITDLVIAGWTGRNQAAIAAHVKEMAQLGIRPPQTPMFYRVATSLLTAANEIEVIGRESSGERSSCYSTRAVRS